MTSRGVVAVMGALGASFVVAAGGACGSNESSTADAATVDAHAPSEASRSDGATAPPHPPGLPEGWRLFGEYDPSCGFYIPTAPQFLPPPIAWEPCENVVGDAGLPPPAGIVCRRMVLDWAPNPNTGKRTSLWVRGWSDAGKVSLLLNRFMDDWTYTLTADVDGPVRSAVLATGQCVTLLSDANAGNVLYRIRDNPTATSHPTGGAFGGSANELTPKVYLPRGHARLPSAAPSLAVGAHAFVESLGADWLYSLATGDLITTIPHPEEEADLQYVLHRFHGDDLFWIADSAARTLVKSWSSAQGTRTLAGYPTDPSRAVAGFGTDGVHMVWIEGSARTDFSVKAYAVYETWTAPYSTDPVVVGATKRRLRSEYPGSLAEENAVGCGYAAHLIYGPPSKRGFRLLRLSDGLSWEVVVPTAEPLETFNVYRPIAVTCDEVFVTATAKSDYQIARIRIDSLGPGLPPD